MKKVPVEITVKVVVEVSDVCTVEDVINEMDYSFNSMILNTNISDTEIIDFQIK